ncbi:zf-HC2 domain-containing protein [bacterium]|nr:MAG: zf-HC2 domain-containing protein [bacterium]
MNLFSCWRTRVLLDLFVDDRLDEAQAGRVAEHIAACAGCRAEADALSPVASLKGPTPPVPAGLVAAILKAHEESRAETMAGLESWRPSPAFAAAAAAAALLLVSQAVPGPTTRGAAKPAAEAKP